MDSQYFRIAKNCADLMLFLVNDILDFAQYEEKTLMLNMEKVRIKELLEQCISILQF